MQASDPLLAQLDAYRPQSNEESAAVQRIRELASLGDVWGRSSPVHATGSALIVHPPTRRVLLRWHERMQAWLQVGGHADPGERDTFGIAMREAEEETGLHDLTSWPEPTRPTLIQIVIVPVPAGKGESAHHHADFRYALATATPDEATPETPSARLAWLDLEEALATVTEDNLRVCIKRLADLRPGANGEAQWPMLAS